MNPNPARRTAPGLACWESNFGCALRARRTAKKGSEHHVADVLSHRTNTWVAQDPQG